MYNVPMNVNHVPLIPKPHVVFFTAKYVLQAVLTIV